MSKRVLITGVSGFVGKHLARELYEQSHLVTGLGYSQLEDSTLSGLLQEYWFYDLTKPEQVAKLDLSGIDAVINLAGLARVGESFNNPEVYKSVNVKVLSTLAEELLKQNSAARIVAVSTGAVYDANQPMPLQENSKTTHKSSPYASSKLHMEKAAEEFRSKGLDIIIVRPFNHIGPGQGEGFLLPDLYSKVEQALKSDKIIKVGNISTRRDYTDVRDIVRAYAMLALTPTLKHGIYNVCSGKSRTGEEILKLLLETMGAEDSLKVEIDQSLIRPSDPSNLYGNYERLRTETGWRPLIALEQTVRDFVTF